MIELANLVTLSFSSKLFLKLTLGGLFIYIIYSAYWYKFDCLAPFIPNLFFLSSHNCYNITFITIYFFLLFLNLAAMHHLFEFLSLKVIYMYGFIL